MLYAKYSDFLKIVFQFKTCQLRTLTFFKELLCYMTLGKSFFPP